MGVTSLGSGDHCPLPPMKAAYSAHPLPAPGHVALGFVQPRSTVRTQSTPHQLPAPIDPLDVDDLARVADVGHLRIIRFEQAAGAGFAPECNLQRADHVLAAARQWQEKLGHAL